MDVSILQNSICIVNRETEEGWVSIAPILSFNPIVIGINIVLHKRFNMNLILAGLTLKGFEG